MNLPKLSFPKYNFKIKEEQSTNLIFDPVRKKYVSLQPEEWVRQNLIRYMKEKLEHPFSRMTVEKGLKIKDKIYKTDLIIYNKRGEEKIICECKSYNEKLSQKTLDQVGIYNLVHGAEYILITNGINFMVFHIDKGNHKINPIDFIPDSTKI